MTACEISFSSTVFLPVSYIASRALLKTGAKRGQDPVPASRKIISKIISPRYSKHPQCIYYKELLK